MPPKISLSDSQGFSVFTYHHTIFELSQLSMICFIAVSALLSHVSKRNKLYVGTILIKNGTMSMKVGTIAIR